MTKKTRELAAARSRLVEAAVHYLTLGVLALHQTDGKGAKTLVAGLLSGDHRLRLILDQDSGVSVVAVSAIGDPVRLWTDSEQPELNEFAVVGRFDA